jgi:hypothetical protein
LEWKDKPESAVIKVEEVIVEIIKTEPIVSSEE